MDDLKKASGEKVRFVIVTPTRHEKAGPPLPDPEPINAKLSIYRDALSKIAEDRKCAFVDLFGQFRRPIPLTDNGIHLTENGYRVLSGTFVGFMKSTSRTGFWVGIDFKKQASRQHDTEIKDLKLNGDECQFKVVDPTKGDANGPWRFLRVYGLPDGRYTLKIDGRDNVTHTAAAWAKGTTISIPAAQRRYDQLRQTIVEKNELYFYQWRPQNVTYLLLFRKHEQGNNAVEIPQFNPLIAAKEKEVAKLREPVTRTFEIVKAKGGAK
jgi:hypothetical protein